MGVKKLKPTSPGRRFQTVSDFEAITKSKPEKSLLAKQKRSSGRNAKGRITSRHRGGGHKRRYRIVDFRRDKDGIPARLAAIDLTFTVYFELAREERVDHGQAEHGRQCAQAEQGQADEQDTDHRRVPDGKIRRFHSAGFPSRRCRRSPTRCP